MLRATRFRNKNSALENKCLEVKGEKDFDYEKELFGKEGRSAGCAGGC